MIDGDRIGVLFTTFYKNLVERLREETNKINESSNLVFIKTVWRSNSPLTM